MRPGNPALGLFFDLTNHMVVRMMGANINRRTIENIQRAGWRILVDEHLSSDIVRWIEAQPCETDVRTQLSSVTQKKPRDIFGESEHLVA